MSLTVNIQRGLFVNGSHKAVATSHSDQTARRSHHEPFDDTMENVAIKVRVTRMRAKVLNGLQSGVCLCGGALRRRVIWSNAQACAHATGKNESNLRCNVRHQLDKDVSARCVDDGLPAEPSSGNRRRCVRSGENVLF